MKDFALRHKRALILLSLLLVLALVAFSPVYQGTQRFREVITQTLNVTTSATIQDATLDDAVLTDATITNVTLTNPTLSGPVVSGGGLTASSGLTVTGTISQAINTSNFGMPTILTKAITYTAAAGGTGIVATIPDGQIWFVHKVFVRTTTNFDATGDDATLIVGDGNDPDGFLAANDAALQAAFTEATGFEPGFYGIEQGSGGAYTTDDGGPFVYLQSGAAETIDYTIGEASGTTLSAGAATIYVIYTRVQ